MRDLPALLRPRRRHRRQRHQGVSRQPAWPAARPRRDDEPAIAATLIKRLDGSRWQALVKPAKRLVAGDVVRFGSEGRVCFLEQLDATVEQKGQGDEGGEVTLAFAFHGAVLDQALAERGDMPLPPYIASRREVDERDRDRLPDHVRARGGFGGGADRGAAFHRKPHRGAARARHRSCSA